MQKHFAKFLQMKSSNYVSMFQVHCLYSEKEKYQ